MQVHPNDKDYVSYDKARRSALLVITRETDRHKQLNLVDKFAEMLSEAFYVGGDKDDFRVAIWTELDYLRAGLYSTKLEG